MLANAPTSILVEGHGFSGGSTIAANSATIDGVALTHSAITVNNDGTFGAGMASGVTTCCHVSLSPSTNLPFGNAVFTIAGQTFQWKATGNQIILLATTTFAGTGALITSIVGTAGTGTGVATLNAASYMPGIGKGDGAALTSTTGSAMALFGYGFVPQTKSDGTQQTSAIVLSTIAWNGMRLLAGNGLTYKVGNGNPVPSSPGCTGTTYAGCSGADANGAIFLTSSLADTPSASSGTSVTPWTVTITQTTGAPGTVQNPTFNITPWIDLSGYNHDNSVAITLNGATTIAQAINAASFNTRYSCTSTTAPTNCGGASTAATQVAGTQGSNILFHGFTSSAYSSGTQTITLTLPDTSISPIVSIGSCFSSVCMNGTAVYSAPSQVMTLASGSYSITAKDTGGAPASATATNLVKFTPVVTSDLTFTSALTSTSGQPTQTTVLRSGQDVTASRLFGVRGFAANTQYTVALGYVSPVTLGTFTTDAYGDIPVPGVTLTIPAATAGIHIVSIWQGTTNVLLGNVASAFTYNTIGFQIGTTSAVFYSLFGIDGASENVAAGAVASTASSANTALGTSPTAISLYGDALYSVSVNITPAPSAGGVGNSVTLSGVGLAPSTTYYATFTTTTGNTGASGQVYFTFTSTATGSIPAGTSFTIPVKPATTYESTERASTYYIHFSTGSEYPGTQDGQSTFVLQAAANLNSTSVAAGHSVTLSANGLAASNPYSVVFNYAVSSSGNTFTGPVVASLTTDANGQGSATFVVPAGTAPGSYVVQLVSPGATAPTAAWLVNPATLSVTGAGTGTGQGACNSTSCYTASGSPTQATLGSNQAVSVAYTNTANAAVTGIVYAVVHNSIGQTVYYTTATLQLAAGQSGTAYAVLFGLPSGTYSVTVFVTSTTGQAISATSTVSVTL